jgi:8-hydroxy-5-deazaflavin:NADPH oxidoreductase
MSTAIVGVGNIGSAVARHLVAGGEPVLFYATDDEAAAKTIERLIRAAGFEPWKAGGVAAAGRIEAPSGDLHQYGFNGEVVDIDRARSATGGSGA